MAKFFVAYPNSPNEIGLTIEHAVLDYNRINSNAVRSWKAMNIIGDFIPKKIIQEISDNVLIADITHLNYNVLYEIGYAIGQRKYILLIRNASLDDGKPTIQEVGIFDTLGYTSYQNSGELVEILTKNESNQPYKGEQRLNLTAPVYLMNTQYKTDFSSRIVARINKAKLFYRSFDPAESPRLSAHEAITEVSESYGVVVQLLTRDSRNSVVHNLRAAFIAGLANGMSIPMRLMQFGYDPIPIDYRDDVDIYKKLEDIDTIIADFVTDVTSEIQTYNPSSIRFKPSFLEKLDLGASAAENELSGLSTYYMKTDAYYKASRGEVQLVIGRKGTGKSAIFYQIVRQERGSSKNIVLDLQPDGYKLLKFKEHVLDHLEAGTFQHTVMAFWEYLLLLEVANKILDNDRSRHLSFEKLTEPYKALEAAYKAEKYVEQGDFSERMGGLIDKLNARFNKPQEKNGKIRLTSPEITGLIHETNIKDLKQALAEYLKYKERIWILFDNIDKGWPSSGVTDADIIIIRSLIDAAKNLKRFFEKSKVNLYPLIFLRSDVYHHLVLGTSDRQKEAKVSLDWTDQDMLTRLIQLRILANEDVKSTEDNSFNELWREIAVSHYKGEDSFQFIVDRSLMRPRFLIIFIGHCKSFAVNLNHKKIEESDIAKGFQAYSADILSDISLEIHDVFPQEDDVLSAFYLSKDRLTEVELRDILNTQIQNEDKVDKLIEILLWYGFLGLVTNGDEVNYIYTVNYNIDLLKTIIRKAGSQMQYLINPGFWPSLHITST